MTLGAPGPGGPQILAGRYRLDRVIGKGAMGRVWAAYDQTLTRWVAVKEVVFPPGTPSSEQDQVAERAMREARAIASVSNAHVVTLFDLLQVGRVPAIVMELLDAASVSAVLARVGTVEEATAATIGLGVSEALVAAAGQGITHRDVKPGNVLLCRDGRIKLTDFGIARSLAENTMTATGLLLGSPAFISPEVAAGDPATAASDAWGLGATLYSCVEGKPPYDRGDPLKTLAAVVTDPAPRPAGTGRLAELIVALLSKDPTRRMPLGQAQLVLADMADPTGGARLATRYFSPPAPGTGGRPAVRAGGTGLQPVIANSGGPAAVGPPTGGSPTGGPAVGGMSAGGARSGMLAAAPGSTGMAPRSTRSDSIAGLPADFSGWAVGPQPPHYPGADAQGTARRPFVSFGSAAPAVPPLPPPPWADQNTAALTALPARAAERPIGLPRSAWMIAALIFLLAAAAGLAVVKLLSG